MTDEHEAAVFIVDDDEAVRDSIAELVSSVGLHACTFASAQQFLDAFDRERPGCLVLDVRMAKMSGPALQEKLGAQGATIPIVFISGHGDIAVAVKTIKAAAVDFVQKPYRDQHLLDSINEALQRDAERRQAAGVRNGFTERQATLTEREREVIVQQSHRTSARHQLSHGGAASQSYPRQARRPLCHRAHAPHVRAAPYVVPHIASAVRSKHAVDDVRS
jgi:two-component system response regulator DctR